MGRIVQIILGIGLAGLLLVLALGPLREPLERLTGARVSPVVPTVQPEEKPGGPAPLAVAAQPESGPPGSGEPGAAKVGPETGQPNRLPAQIANLVGRQKLEKVIEKYAQQYGVDQDLVWAVIRQESGFNPQAVSPKGAMGLMQLMPGTAAMMGVSDAFDVEQNIAGGIKYLERCLNQFNQDVGLALAAYNAGPDNVVKYQGCPPFAETRHYVASVLKAYAGGSMRDGLMLIGVNHSIEEDAPELEKPGGLAWRVPRAQWRISTPQCKFGSPRWKVAVIPF